MASYFVTVQCLSLALHLFVLTAAAAAIHVMWVFAIAYDKKHMAVAQLCSKAKVYNNHNSVD